MGIKLMKIQASKYTYIKITEYVLDAECLQNYLLGIPANRRYRCELIRTPSRNPI